MLRLLLQCLRLRPRLLVLRQRCLLGQHCLLRLLRESGLLLRCRLCLRLLREGACCSAAACACAACATSVCQGGCKACAAGAACAQAAASSA